MPATLADLTCDSDGKVDRFINPRVSRSSRIAFWAAALTATCSDSGNVPAWETTNPGATPALPAPPQGGDPLPALPLHPLRLGEKYYLAVFLTGVYQEVMGSIHNMFGSLNTGEAGVAVLHVACRRSGCCPRDCSCYCRCNFCCLSPLLLLPALLLLLYCCCCSPP